jgi:hypothetical protein
VEVAWSGHLEGLGVFLLVAAVDALESGRAARSGAALLLSTGTKLFPVALVPACLRAPGVTTRRRVAFLAGGVAAAVAATAPFLRAAPDPLASARVYASTWAFNSLSWESLLRHLPEPGGRWIAAAAFAAASIEIARRRLAPAPAALGVGAALVALSPTVHPWYVLWLTPFLTLHRSWPLWSFTISVLASYWVLIGYRAAGVWELPAWVMAFEYAVPALVWIAGRRYAVSASPNARR